MLPSFSQIFSRKFNLLNILLIVSGIQPVRDRRLNGSKYSLIGIFFVIVNAGMVIYCDHKLEDEQELLRKVMKGIMFAMTYMLRIINLLYPLVNVLASIYQFESMATFLELEDQLDMYLKRSSVDLTGMYSRIKSGQLLSTILAIILAIISGVSATTFPGTFETAQFHSVYTGVFLSLNYIAVTLKMCNNYNGFFLRQRLFNRHLTTIISIQEENMNKKDRKRF